MAGCFALWVAHGGELECKLSVFIVGRTFTGHSSTATQPQRRRSCWIFQCFQLNISSGQTFLPLWCRTLCFTVGTKTVTLWSYLRASGDISSVQNPSQERRSRLQTEQEMLERKALVLISGGSTQKNPVKGSSLVSVTQKVHGETAFSTLVSSRQRSGDCTASLLTEW